MTSFLYFTLSILSFGVTSTYVRSYGEDYPGLGVLVRTLVFLGVGFAWLVIYFMEIL